MSEAPSQNASASVAGGELIHRPNSLRAKVGGARFTGLNAGALAKAEAALKSLSSQFAQWLQDELDKLEAARAVVHRDGMTKEAGEGLYTRAHDLKGLGTTYEFPIITRIAGSLCRLIETPEHRAIAPIKLIDAHIDAIKASVRDDIRDDQNPLGRVLAEELERQVAAYATPASGSATAP